MISDNGLRVEYMPISEIRPSPRNPKDHDLGAIHASVSRFGYVAPAIIDDRTGRMVAGHGRLEDLRRRKASGESPPERIIERNGEWLMPVLRGVSFRSDEDAEGYLLADNRLSELGGWDDSKLADLLSDLAADDALEGTGYDGDDIDRLLQDLQNNTINAIHVSEQAQRGSDDELEAGYLNSTVRQIVLVFSVEEYQWALGILERLIATEDLDTNTDAIIRLLKEWDTENGSELVDVQA